MAGYEAPGLPPSPLESQQPILLFSTAVWPLRLPLRDRLVLSIAETIAIPHGNSMKTKARQPRLLGGLVRNLCWSVLVSLYPWALRLLRLLLTTVCIFSISNMSIRPGGICYELIGVFKLPQAVSSTSEKGKLNDRREPKGQTSCSECVLGVLSMPRTVELLALLLEDLPQDAPQRCTF